MGVYDPLAYNNQPSESTQGIVISWSNTIII